jgi:hypothetical protein
MKETNIHSKTITHKAWNQARGQFQYSFVFAFKTKGQYLEFRRCWKENYAALSGAIRDLKALIKTTMRSRDYAGKHQRDLHALKSEATVQLSMLRSAKPEAGRQYLASRQVTS